ncbi:hypothetical protein CONPUDRAFT_74444 [Coniophora puteana RWD-64-598 SS2]|uniref:DUF6533 domain-containing protein n=1 Tax=Coniophora puteana (strain RWD-64-598) TaxID=741705 RepID=A0A5M3MID1_CONPW|nr:uncharacterized protein CONPUDRAFT_74444 [Coniophora puteana RWD-64-598 SS2]EIW78853.1 hypothetical protein CONPUDRAFT_74444 [Coniophora puteana RWD-64-598 SS2]
MFTTSIPSKLIKLGNEILIEDYTTGKTLVAVMTWVLYDYLLSFALEVDYIWCTILLTKAKLRYLGLMQMVLRTMIWVLSAKESTKVVHSQYWSSVSHPQLLCSPCKVSSDSYHNLWVLTYYRRLVGMMTVRVYILLGRSQKLLAILAACFLAAQGVSAVVAIYYIRRSAHLISESSADDISVHLCEVSKSHTLSWTLTATASSRVVYETILCGLSLVYVFKHLPETTSLRRSPARFANELWLLMVRDNLVYFFAVLFAQIINIISSPARSEATKLIFNNISNELNAFQYAMVGPWMIISLRKSYEKGIAQRTIESHGLSDIGFASARQHEEPHRLE